MVKAGIGEPQANIIPVSGDQTPLTLDKHYLAIDAVSWFVNQESSWFTDKIATGTLSIRIGTGESYNVALGVYELKGGAKVAPVFSRPVLPARAFRGGPITLQAVISGVAQSNGVGKILQGVADAALGVVGTMVQTAALSGPSQVLGAAGGALVGGVRALLNAQDNRFRLFDPTTGIEKTIDPTDLSGPTMYVLLHRGTKLDPKKLAVAGEAGAEAPSYEGKRLEDGVWLLLRLRRLTEYPVEPVWLTKFRSWVESVRHLADSWEANMITAKVARAKLTGGGEGAPSVYDVYRELTAEILSDGLLTATESGSYLAALRAIWRLALRLVEEGDRAEFDEAMTQLASGTITDVEVRTAMAKAILEAQRARGVAPAVIKVETADTGSIPIGDYPRLQRALSPTEQ
jgi:hypothetical protein